MSRTRRPPTQGWVGTLERILGHQVTRLVLSGAIIISLIPHDWIHATDSVFLLVFLPEFVARLIVSSRREADPTPDPLQPTGWRFPRSADFLLLLVDFVALASFLPWATGTTRWLRLFRLTRTVMLLRYWSPLVQDLWAVTRRRERSRQITLMLGAVALVAFAGTVLLNHTTDEVGEDFDGDGNVGDEHDHVFWVRMYWALRQIEDPGNMLSSPHEFATLVVSITLTFFGLFLISFLIGIGTDAVSEVMQLSRLRSPGLQRHTVLLNLSQATRALLYEVMGEYQKLMPDGLTPLTPRWFGALRRNARQQREFVVVGRDEEPPDFMRDPQFARIIYRENTDEDDEAFLDRADVPLARRIVLLADVEADEPDDETVRTLITIVERLRDVSDDENVTATSLIAEILDESNIGAAHRAIARASTHVDAHIIPTERLLALFTFSVARRQQAAGLFFELLASNGHELYSYDYRQSARTDGRVPDLSSDPGDALESLYWRGLGRPPAKRVLPLGVLVADPALSSRLDADVVLNPTPGSLDEDGPRRFSGFVALAPNSRATREFADEVLNAPTAAAPSIPTAQFVAPNLLASPTNPMQKVLICGFRPATVNLIESILTVAPNAEVLILVRDKHAKKEALDAFAGHTNMVRTGLFSGGVRGTFAEGSSPDELQCVAGNGSGLATGRIVVEIGDWTSSRQLLKLPRKFGTTTDMDLVVLISSERHSSDATTATALMKLEHLREHIGEASPRQQTIVAELINAELAHRLERRYAGMGRDDVVVFSIHELRAFFMFQSVVVPNFNLIYSELFAAWGQSFSRLETEGGEGECTFEQLAALLHTQGKALFAAETRNKRGEHKLLIAQGDPDQDGRIELASVEAIWVLKPERPPGTTRYAAVAGGSGPISVPDPAPAPAAPPVAETTEPQPQAAPVEPTQDPVPPRGGTVVGPAPTAPPSDSGPPSEASVTRVPAPPPLRRPPK